MEKIMLKVARIGWQKNAIHIPIVLLDYAVRKQLQVVEKDVVMVKVGERKQEAVVFKSHKTEIGKGVTMNNFIVNLLGGVKVGDEVELEVVCAKGEGTDVDAILREIQNESGFTGEEEIDGERETT